MNQIPSIPNELHRRATRKAFLKLIPLMCAIYFMSFLDRTNVALAKIHLAADVGISAAAYGLGAGGEAGVAKAIDILAKEMLTTMGLCGVNTVAEINDDVLAV